MCLFSFKRTAFGTLRTAELKDRSFFEHAGSLDLMKYCFARPWLGHARNGAEVFRNIMFQLADRRNLPLQVLSARQFRRSLSSAVSQPVSSSGVALGRSNCSNEGGPESPQSRAQQSTQPAGRLTALGPLVAPTADGEGDSQKRKQRDSVPSPKGRVSWRRQEGLFEGYTRLQDSEEEVEVFETEDSVMEFAETSSLNSAPAVSVASVSSMAAERESTPLAA
eukprot:6181127-Pleurochrysis_carterae.AAC.1